MHSGLQHYNSPAILRGVSVTFSVPCIEKYCVCSHDSCKPIPCCNLYLQHLPPFLFNFKKHCLHSVPGSLASVEIGWRAGSWFQDGNWTKTQDSGLRWRKQEGAEGLAAISTLVSAHKQEDKLHLEQERWLLGQNGNKTLVSITSLRSDKGIICLDIPYSQFSSMKKD